MGVVVAPALATYTTGGKVVHARFYTLIAEVVVGTEGIELIGGYLPEISDEFGHFLDAAPKFIA